MNMLTENYFPQCFDQWKIHRSYETNGVVIGKGSVEGDSVKVVKE